MSLDALRPRSVAQTTTPFPAPTPDEPASAPESVEGDRLATQAAPTEAVPPAELARQVRIAQHGEAKSFLDRVLDRVSSGWQGALARLETEEARPFEAVARSLKDVPVLGKGANAAAWMARQAAQFQVGVLGGAGTFVGGVAQMGAHPVETVKGLYSLAEHIPLLPFNPLRLARAGYDIAFDGASASARLHDALSPTAMLADDAAFGKALVQGITAPYREAIARHRYADAAGRAVFDLGSLVLGAGSMGAAREGAEGAEAIAGARLAERVPRRIVSRSVRPNASVIEAVGKPYTQAGRLAARRAREALDAAKAEEALRPMTAERAAQIAASADGSALYEALRPLEADKLRQLGELEPTVPPRLARLLRERQAQGLSDINEVAGRFGLEATGPVKSWPSILSKLDRESALQRKLGVQQPVVFGEMHDLNRARLNVPVLDPEAMQGMTRTLMDDMRTRYPDRQFHFVVKNAGVREDVLHNPEHLYRGRINLQIQDVTGGIRGSSFEVQIGPRLLTKFWDTPFAVEGRARALTIHDAVYKGVATIRDPDLVRKLGRGLNPERTLNDTEALLAGRAAMREAVKGYKEGLSRTITLSEQGIEEVNPAELAPLRQKLRAIARALGDDPRAPEGLR